MMTMTVGKKCAGTDPERKVRSVAFRAHIFTAGIPRFHSNTMSWRCGEIKLPFNNDLQHISS